MKRLISVFLYVFFVAIVVISTGCSNAATASTSSTTSLSTTIPAQNLTSPMVTNFSPENGATGVPVNQSISVTFTLAMNPSSINTATFILMQGSMPVPGTVSYYGNTAIFTPQDDLSKDTDYSATIDIAIANMEGQHLQNGFTWTFTTGSIDTVDPYIVSTIPSFNSIFPVDPNNPFASNGNVPVNDSITAYFNEAMDPSTINASTFTVMQGTTPVAGTVKFDGYETAILTPTKMLSPNTAYIAMITTAVKCLGGNSLAQNFVWSFTTGLSQTTAPIVVSAVTANGVSGVPLNSSITAKFSEAINPMSINVITFTLAEGKTPVDGTVSFDGINAAVFTPLNNLSSATIYTATVTTGVTDLAGIHMANSYTWTFTTGQLDTIHPTVVSTNPQNGATGVAINSTVSIIFSEGLNPTTLAFVLKRGNNSIPGTITYDPTFTVVTFTPGINLSSNTPYTASVSGWGLDGYSPVSAIWSFRTAP